MSLPPDNIERRGKPEHQRESNILTVDPADLMRDNPAALIVNKEMYDRMSAYFSFDQFDPPQVAWVTVYSSEDHKPVNTLFVIDGLTRTKYAYDHKGQPVPADAPFTYEAIPVRDVTLSAIQNPLIVLSNERVSGQKALTMEQYLRAVVPPTVEHSEIADDRIAAHLIRAWEGIVGKEIAEQFSAIAALSFLANDNISIATDALLKKTLEAQPTIIGKITGDDRKRVKEALISVASIVRQAKRSRRDIAQAGYFLVATGSPVIGGQKESQRQIYGLLHHPVVEGKIVRASQPGLAAEQVRVELGRLMATAFTRFADDRAMLAELIKASEDPVLSLNQLMDVLSSSDPRQNYTNLVQDTNRIKLKDEYLRSVKRDEVTPTERRLIENLGHKTYLPTFSNSVDAIKNAESALKIAADWKNRFEKDKENLLKRGVRPQTIEQAILKISSQENILILSDSPTSLTQRINELRRIVSKADEDIAIEILAHQIGNSVDQIYGERLQTGHGPIVRESIIWYILHAPDVDATNDYAVKRSLRDLNKLPEDIQTEVINGFIRIEVAIKRQNDRRIQAIRVSPAPNVPPIETLQPIEVPPAGIEKTVFSRQAAALPQKDEVELTKEDIKKRRLEVNNNRLSEVLGRFDSLTNDLRSIDLEPQELTAANREKLSRIEIMLEKIRSGHPNVVNVIDVLYPQSQRDVEQLRETRLEKEIEETSRDTRTRR